MPDAVPASGTGSCLKLLFNDHIAVTSPPRRPVCPSRPASWSLVLPGLSHHSAVADPRTGQGARARGHPESLTDLLHKNFTIHEVQRHHHLFPSSVVSRAALAPPPTPSRPGRQNPPEVSWTFRPSLQPSNMWPRPTKTSHLSSFTLSPPSSPPLHSASPDLLWFESSPSLSHFCLPTPPPPRVVPICRVFASTPLRGAMS